MTLMIKNTNHNAIMITVKSVASVKRPLWNKIYWLLPS